MPLSSWMMIWVFLAMRAENFVGSPSASSKEFVCSDWVPPNTDAMASIVVRMMLLYGSWNALPLILTVTSSGIRRRERSSCKRSAYLFG